MFVPDGLAPGAPLVVVLHGCTQSAADYDAGSGWSQLAARHGFALLYPEQTRRNNPNLCFNWFQPRDTTRGAGEVASIHAMTETMCAAHGLDRARVFVTGLSAGGAMTGAMLAAYPETFAAGAIIAGLPFGCASGVGEALECMGGRGGPVSDTALGGEVRAASPTRACWPRVSVWHGSADMTVTSGNGDAVARQWADVHGLPVAPTRTEMADGHVRSLWADAKGAVVLEHYAVAGMGHGTPLRPGHDVGEAGAARAHMLDAGISSTDRIAAFFGVGPAVGAGTSTARASKSASTRPKAVRTPTAEVVAQAHSGPQKVIEDALRAAGLMR
jgi:poly(hydroxyalkanoate) depolymerase family esterase